MTDELTNKTQQPGELQLQKPEQQLEDPAPQQAQAMQSLQAQAVKCSKCGAMNDAEAVYCASCGAPLRMAVCPNCGSSMDADADFCEVCHHYVASNVCSFCGAQLSGQEVFCHECGSPRGGIVCPTCRTLNEFAFCKKCGRALNDDAVQLAAQIRSMPQYKELLAASRELVELDKQLPYINERDENVGKECEKLRQRVLTLLAKDRGMTDVKIEPLPQGRMSRIELDARKAEVARLLTELLDQMALPPQPSPARARNFAMAQKPAGTRLAWLCNYKHAMHSSPCGCAKPQMGGKWVILGHGSQQEIKDDN